MHGTLIRPLRSAVYNASVCCPHSRPGDLIYRLVPTGMHVELVLLTRKDTRPTEIHSYRRLDSDLSLPTSVRRRPHVVLHVETSAIFD